MATFIQSIAPHAASGTSNTASATVTAGNTLIFAIAYTNSSGQTFTGLTGCAGDTFVSVDTVTEGAFQSLTQGYILSTHGGSPCNFVASFSASLNSVITFEEVSGLVGLDVHAMQTQNLGTGTHTTSSGNATTTANGEWIVGTYTDDSGVTPTAGSGFTLRQASGTVALEDGIQTNAGLIAATFNYTTGAFPHVITGMMAFQLPSGPTISYLDSSSFSPASVGYYKLSTEAY